MNHPTRNRPGVLLVNMPWSLVREPSPALGILKTVLHASGICCDVLEAPMRLLRYLKPETYGRIADTWAAADFLFTREFEDEVSPRQLQVLERLVRDDEGCVVMAHKQRTPPEKEVARLLRIRQEIIPQYLQDLMTEIDFSRYSVIGFSCLFDQTLASLALARRIKQAHPGMMIAFGGYALHRPVGPALQKSFAEMDVVAYGDGEPVVVPLWEAANGLRPLREVPNITYRDSEGQVVESACSVKIDLDDSPAPNYDDFFRQREEARDKYGIAIPIGEISVESSRGCWYGQKAHCTFCGIDDETLRYRVKSAGVTIEQLDELHDRYGVTAFRFADYIMPLTYLRDFLPEMARRGAPYNLFYETKANLKAAQFELCASAGVTWMQPGIESFSSQVLRLMAKGVSAAQNVFALYSMLSRGVFPLYNLIFGFPFESPADYRAMLQIIPSLYHFFPPIGVGPVVVMRHAPLGESPEKFGVATPLKAHWRYELMFSPDFLRRHNLTLEEFCYRYENPYGQPDLELRALYDALQHQILRWFERYGLRMGHGFLLQFTRGQARLNFAEEGEGIAVRDTRFSDSEQVYHFGPAHRRMGDLLRARPLTQARLIEEMSTNGFHAEETKRAVGDLTDARVVLAIDREYVWLAFNEVTCADRTAQVQKYSRSNADIRASNEWPERRIATSEMETLAVASGQGEFKIL